MPTLSTLPELLTVNDIATWLKTTVSAVYHMRERKRLPEPCKVSGRLLWRQDDLAKWIAKQRAVSPSETR